VIPTYVGYDCGLKGRLPFLGPRLKAQQIVLTLGRVSVKSIRIRRTLLLGVCTAFLIAVFAATAFDAPEPNQINIFYDPVKKEAHESTYDLLKQHSVLEKMQQLLSPFKLPRPLRLSLSDCDGEADAFYSDDKITICYEYVAELQANMPEETTKTGVAPIDAVIGPFIDTTLHEFGHALFDMLQIPVFGREEDAADQFAAYIYLHLGKAEARRLIMGTAYAYFTEAQDEARSPSSLSKFSGEHGTPAQRMFNVLCLAYGADDELFADLVTRGYLPTERAETCDEEYTQVAIAFKKLVGSHLDADLESKLMKRSWLPDQNTRVAN
jgi:hypothetical protein